MKKFCILLFSFILALCFTACEEPDMRFQIPHSDEISNQDNSIMRIEAEGDIVVHGRDPYCYVMVGNISRSYLSYYDFETKTTHPLILNNSDGTRFLFSPNDNSLGSNWLGDNNCGFYYIRGKLIAFNGNPAKRTYDYSSELLIDKTHVTEDVILIFSNFSKCVYILDEVDCENGFGFAKTNDKIVIGEVKINVMESSELIAFYSIDIERWGYDKPERIQADGYIGTFHGKYYFEIFDYIHDIETGRIYTMDSSLSENPITVEIKELNNLQLKIDFTRSDHESDLINIGDDLFLIRYVVEEGNGYLVMLRFSPQGDILSFNHDDPYLLVNLGSSSLPETGFLNQIDVRYQQDKTDLLLIITTDSDQVWMIYLEFNDSQNIIENHTVSLGDCRYNSNGIDIGITENRIFLNMDPAVYVNKSTWQLEGTFGDYIGHGYYSPSGRYASYPLRKDGSSGNVLYDMDSKTSIDFLGYPGFSIVLEE